VTTPLRLGLVGFGKIAGDQHLPAIAATGGFELVAVADPHAVAPGVRNYANATDMLAGEPQLDALVLCQPPQARFAAARAALLAGKHVFLEKPPSATLSEAETLVAIARDAGLTLFSAWHSREAAAVSRAKQWLAGKTLRSVRIDWKEDVRAWHPGQAWIWQPGGFGVFDPGINALSILTAILPETVTLTSAELHRPSNCATPIAARLAMDAAGVPIAADFDFRQTGPQNWDIRVSADEGELLLSRGGNHLAIDGADQPSGVEQEYRALYRRFGELIARKANDVDLAPLRLVDDAFRIGRTSLTEPFVE
jgi:predicted dehydrogenase